MRRTAFRASTCRRSIWPLTVSTMKARTSAALPCARDPDASGWRLQRLEVTNPESKLSIIGRWVDWRSVAHRRRGAAGSTRHRQFFFAARMEGGHKRRFGAARRTDRVDRRSVSGRYPIAFRTAQTGSQEWPIPQDRAGRGKAPGHRQPAGAAAPDVAGFRDVFSNGFSFDRICANLTIATAWRIRRFPDGRARQRAWQCGAGRPCGETQNLIVRITPSPVRKHCVGRRDRNPGVGLAALLAQKALKDPVQSDRIVRIFGNRNLGRPGGNAN